MEEGGELNFCRNTITLHAVDKLAKLFLNLSLNLIY